MTPARWFAVLAVGVGVATLLWPSDEAVPRYLQPPVSLLGAPPPMPTDLRPEHGEGGDAPAGRAEPRPVRQTPSEPAAPGPFSQRPRPAPVQPFGAAAPLAPGQDTSAYYWGGVKPDLSD